MDWFRRVDRQIGMPTRRRSLNAREWVGIAMLVGAWLGPATWATLPEVDLSADEWAEAVRQRGVDPATVPNPLEFTDEMRAFARDAARGVATQERLEHLQRKLFQKHNAPFDYDLDTTLTAREAFSTRRGNCVAFTNLFISMARSVGIPVQPALVGRRGDVERDGDLMVVNNHIVAIYRHNEGTTIFDFFRTRREELVNLTPIDDLWSAAIYLNNLGVRALRDGDPETAAEILDRAVKLAPRYAAVYANLGVAQRRGGDADSALDSYILGLHIEPRNESLRNNVHALLLERARLTKSSAPADTSAWTRADALTWQGKVALGNRQLRPALRLFRRAHRSDRARAEPLISIARCELIRGKLPAARRALARALAIQPDDAPARRLLDALNRAEPAEAT